MRQAFGWFLLVVGAVALWDALVGDTKTTDYTVVGLLFLVTVLPGALLVRPRKRRD